MREKITEQIQAFRAAIYGEDVRDAYADIAETVCIEAMEELDAVVEKGNYAEAQGNYAKNQGDYAKEQGNYAKTQGDYAKAQGDYAGTQGAAASAATKECKRQTTACESATQSSINQTAECKAATEAAIEAATGHSMVYDPVDGSKKTAQETFENIWKHMLSMFASPITVDEFDALGLTVDEFDALKLTVYEFDTRAKAILMGGEKNV